MRLKHISIIITIVSIFFMLLPLIIIVLMVAGNSNKKNINIYYSNVSSEVLEHKPLVEKYCMVYDIQDYITYILAIIQVESGGRSGDVMQSSESLGLPPNTLDTEASIKQGCFYFSTLIKSAEDKGCDIETAVQAYNYGINFINYVGQWGKKYSFQLAESFAREKSNGTKTSYSNEIAIKKNGGWRYKYGNMFYMLLIEQYLTPMHFDDEIINNIMNEALKYEGYPYVWGGNAPETSFDCSGLTYWCYKEAGINIPMTAQGQYDSVRHIKLSDAKAGDLIFFKNTYATSKLVTHVAIYVDENRMYHAGNPIGYTDYTTNYWQSRIICAGRIINN